MRDGTIWRVGVDSGEAIQVGDVPPDLQGNGGGVWTTEVTSSSLVVTASDSSPCR